MTDITGKRVAFLLTDGFEDSELTAPWQAVTDAGATAVLVSPADGSVAFARDFFAQHKPVGVICHGAWILADADVLQGRTITSYPSLKTDLRNAGATWVDEEVVVDAGLVSSCTPDDLPAFTAKVVEEIAEGAHAGQTV